MTSLPPADDFFAVASAAVSPTVEAPSSSHTHRGISWRWASMAVIAFAAIAIVVWWFLRPDPMPISDPPPDGGSLLVPQSLGGGPILKADPQPEWSMRKLSPYYPEDATLTYYNPPGAGAWSVTALRGPYTALPDLSVASDDRVTVGDVRCGRTMVGGYDGPPETEVAGHTCWRTSGDFSVSVLTVLSDLDETVSLVNEYWESQ